MTEASGQSPAGPDAGASAEPEAAPFDAAAVAEGVIAALDAEDRPRLLEIVSEQHAADLADLIEQITREDRRRLLSALGEDIDPEMLIELGEGARDQVLKDLPPEALASAVGELETDDVVYLIEDLAPEAQAAALDALDAGERAAVEASLGYPEYSAGRLMQREMVFAPPHMTVGELIDRMRDDDDLPEAFYDIVIVDPTFRPVGTVPLSRVMANRRPVVLDALMEEEFRVFQVDQTQEEVGYAFNQYHLVSAPVTDADGRLVGVITIDDAMQALDEEAEEDLFRLSGVGDESLGDAVWAIAWRRFPWLVVNLLTAVMASAVIGLFDAALQEVVALAILMPIVASMGGNAGTQTLTVAVRALATKDLTGANAARIVFRETLVGAVNGLAFALIVGVIGYLWFGGVLLGATLAAAMIVTLIAAGLAGILIPLGLQRAGADPALASTVFVTTVTDVVGFFAFLGLAVVIGLAREGGASAAWLGALPG